MNHIEVMKQMLEALESERPYLGAMPTKVTKAIDAGRQAIAEAEKDEPVVHYNICIECQNADLPDKPVCRECVRNSKWQPLNESSKNPLYTHPQPKHEPLTDEQILHLVDTHIGETNFKYPLNNSDLIHLARAIEAKLKEKNT